MTRADLHQDKARVPESERGLVWIVEDSPLEAEMARRALASSQSVELFPDSPVVLERLANGERPHALVLDCQLPTLSGLEVCRFLREQYDEVELPILMLTVEGRRDDLIEGLLAGANDYLSKPYHVSELLARVGLLVRASQLHRSQARRTSQLALSSEIGRLLSTRSESVAQRCAEAIVRHLDVAGVYVWERDEGRPMHRVAAAGPLALADVDAAIAGAGPTASVYAVGAQSDRLVSEPSWADAPHRTFVREPLVVDARVIGALAVAAQRSLEADELASLAQLADLVAIGLDRARGERERASLLESERHARATAEAANLSKDDFLSVVSHELRTPLNAIAGWVQMLRAGVVTPANSARALETIERNARAQARLIDDLLDVSRISSGKLRIATEPVDLPEVVESAVDSLRPAAAAAGLTLDATIERTGRITGDEMRVKQVVSNLLANSIKFTPRGGRITLQLVADGGQAELRVTDTGQGIKPAFLPHLFERFRQAESSMARSHGGLGLGLAIVRHLVELHGGQVTASSEGEGCGATFVVSLPLARDAGVAPSAAASTRPPAVAALAGLRLLVVDDDDDSRELLERVLTDARARVRAVASVEQAFAAIAEEVPELIVSDIGMPGADGFSFMRRLRALPAELGGRVPAIAVTAYARLEDRLTAEAAGFDLHMPKPVDMDALLDGVARLAARH